MRGSRAPRTGASPPRVWFKDSSEKYLIFVITRVEAGDRAPSCCSGPESPCWPIVGGQRLPVVDTWTSRRLFTDALRRPPPVPCLSLLDPQAVPRAPAGGPAASRPIRAQRPYKCRSASCQGPGRRTGRPGSRSPRVTRRARDLPNLCTFLGTTSRPVEDGHRPDTGSYRPRRALLGCRHLSTAVDKAWDRDAGERGVSRGWHAPRHVVEPGTEPVTPSGARGSRAGATQRLS
jgi:hypothetical protein